MKLIVSENYEALSKQAASDLLELVKSNPQPLLCVASGDTPAGLYKELVGSINQDKIDVSGWAFVALDEWGGLNGEDEGSCRYHLDRQLFHPLKWPESRLAFFDGRVNDLDEECDRIEEFISQHNGIDVAILGLGMNGHIGMNEPGTSPLSRTHVAELDPITQKVGQKYFTKEQELKNGVTLGMATLMESKHIFLLVSGNHKKEILRKVLEGKISEEIPASLLKGHPGLRIYADEQAVSRE